MVRLNVLQEQQTGNGISVIGSLIPSDSMMFDLGSEELKWNDLYCNNVLACGNLTVQGNTTVLNTEVLTVEDNKIVLNSNASVGNIDSGFIVNRFQEDNDICEGDVVQMVCDLILNRYQNLK